MAPDAGVPFRLSHRRESDHVVVEVCGELDLASAPELRSSLLGLIESGVRSIAVDLSAITFIDSTGLTVLVQAHKQMLRREGRLVIRRPSERAMQLFQLTGLDALLDIGDAEHQER